jgi:uncharacterized membrane protein
MYLVLVLAAVLMAAATAWTLQRRAQQREGSAARVQRRISAYAEWRERMVRTSTRPPR